MADPDIIALLRLLYLALIMLGGVLLGDLLLSFWGASLAVGLLYRFTGAGLPDPVLQWAWSVGAGMTAGAMVSVGLWCLLGGWEPPAFLLLVGCGLLAGLLLGWTQHARALAR